MPKYDLNGPNIDPCFIMNTKTLISIFYQSCKYQILKQSQKIECCTYMQRFHRSKIMHNQLSTDEMMINSFWKISKTIPLEKYLSNISARDTLVDHNSDKPLPKYCW